MRPSASEGAKAIAVISASAPVAVCRTGLFANHIGVVALKKSSQRQRLIAPATKMSSLDGCFWKPMKKSMVVKSMPKLASVLFTPPSLVRKIVRPDETWCDSAHHDLLFGG